MTDNSRKLRHASLFSGIGGPEVAASMLGWENVFHCEINPFGRRVLEYWFPESDSYEDITKTDFRRYRGRIDVLTGGFPCQPFSCAGRRKGSEDDRYLWPEMLRAIREIKPTWVVGENVGGIVSMVQPGSETKVGVQGSLFGEDDGLYEASQQYVVETVCQDLEREGYSVQPVLVPACAVGAPHRRDRVFFISRLGAIRSSEDSIGFRCQGFSAERQSNIGRFRQPGSGDSRGLCVSEKIASDPHGRADCGKPGADEVSCGEERISERDKVRESDKSADVRPGLLGLAANSECSGGDKVDNEVQQEKSDGIRPYGKGPKRDAAHPGGEGLSAERVEGRDGQKEWLASHRCPGESSNYDWGTPFTDRWRDFPTVSPIHRGNDGLPFDVDDLAIPYTRWRQESIKAYGNAIVPQVIYEIFKAIEKEMYNV